MPSTFPDVSVGSINLRQISKTAVTESMYSATDYVVSLGYQKWAIDFKFPPLKHEEASLLIGFLSSLNGREGTFTYDLPDTLAINGSAGTSGLVAGASQTGNSLNTDGWVPNTLNLFLPGDKIEVDGHLHTVTTAVHSDASGDATLAIWPNIREASDNSSIVVVNPTSEWRLVTDSIEYTMDVATNYGISFSAMEVI